jgi:DNA-binding response OmpR family regulator
MKKNVLVIEDDNDIQELLKIHLHDLECDVSQAYTGTQGSKLALTEKYDLMILDVVIILNY